MRDERWRTTAAAQHGLISREQARQAGLSASAIRNRLRAGTFVRVLPGVFRVGGVDEPFQLRYAALLYAGPRGAISGPLAAKLHGFPRLGGDEVEVSSSRNLRRAKGIQVRKTKLPGSDVAWVRGMRVTTELRTLLDLAATACEEDLRAVVDHLLRTRRFSAEQLASTLAWRKCPGILLLRKILAGYAELGPATESECEARVFDLVEGWGLPLPVRQGCDMDRERQVRRVDFAWKKEMVALEVDGFFWHSDPAAFERDRLRRNQLTAKGWKVLHITWRALLEGAEPLYHQLRPLVDPEWPLVDQEWQAA